MASADDPLGLLKPPEKLMNKATAVRFGNFIIELEETSSLEVMGLTITAPGRQVFAERSAFGLINENAKNPDSTNTIRFACRTEPNKVLLDHDEADSKLSDVQTALEDLSSYLENFDFEVDPDYDDIDNVVEMLTRCEKQIRHIQDAVSELEYNLDLAKDFFSEIPEPDYDDLCTEMLKFYERSPRLHLPREKAKSEDDPVIARIAANA